MPYITPASIPTAVLYRRLVIPNDTDFLGAVNGALLELENPENWEQVSGISPEDAAAAASIMIEKYWDIPMALGSIILVATITPPIGTLACDGTTYLRADYPNLYDVLHADFIVDATHFKVPNLAPAGSITYCMIAS